MARPTGAPGRRTDSGADPKRYRDEGDREASGDRVSYQGNENPEVTERADAFNNQPEANGNNAPVRENGDAGEAGA